MPLFYFMYVSLNTAILIFLTHTYTSFINFYSLLKVNNFIVIINLLIFLTYSINKVESGYPASKTVLKLTYLLVIVSFFVCFVQSFADGLHFFAVTLR